MFTLKSSMNANFFIFLSVTISSLLIVQTKTLAFDFSYLRSNRSKHHLAFQRKTVRRSSLPTMIYYGENIGKFPEKVREWIIYQGFPKSKMEKASMRNPKLRAWWSDDGNAVLFEASYAIAEGYVGAGTRKIWGNTASYTGPNLSQYGKHAKYHTLRFNYELKLESKNRQQSDPAYAEILSFAKQLSQKIEYDWAKFDGYRGAAPIKTPGMKYAVCQGYSNEVMEKALTLKYVASVEEWATSSHSWNVLNLVDGRKLYLDLTWFDNENINHKTGVVEQTDDYNWGNMTFNEEVFNYANISYSGAKDHLNGSLQRIAKK